METDADWCFTDIVNDAALMVNYGVYEDVYICNGCATDLALRRHLIRQDLKSRVGLHFAAFEEVVNYKASDECTPKHEKGIRQFISCRVCSFQLGCEWFREKNKFVLKLSALTLRKEREFYDPITEQRVGRNMQHERDQLMGMADKDLYLCRDCETPLALFHEWIRRYFRNDKHYILFGHLMNFTYGELGITVEAQAVYCETCCTKTEFGYKILAVTEPADDVIVGRFIVFTKKLLLLKQGKMYDAVTEEPYSKMEQTFIMIKPDGVQRRLVGKIIRRFEKNGLTLRGLKFITVDNELAEKHYAGLSDAPFFNGLVEFIVSGPVVAMVWEGMSAVNTALDMIGGINPTEAAFGTIRGDYASDGARNVIHGSDAVKSAKEEIALWFPEGITEQTSCASSRIDQ